MLDGDGTASPGLREWVAGGGCPAAVVELPEGAGGMSGMGWTLARVASFALYYSGALRLFERADRRRDPGTRCTVLSYHRVQAEPFGYRDIAISPRTFRAHLGYLQRRGYRFLSLQEYGEYLAGDRALECDSVLITFDDGYRDNYTNALPALEAFGIPAAVFLCTGPLDSGTALWWDRIVGSVRSARHDGERTAPDARGIPENISHALARCLRGSDRAASRSVGGLIDKLKALPSEQRDRLVASLESVWPPCRPDELMMTWDMVREMHAAGVGIGAHSITHPDFSRIATGAALLESAGSKRTIEEHLGVSVDSFAYPYGKDAYLTAASVEAVMESGFRWAFTTENGRNEPGADPYRLRRDGMRDVPAHVLAVRLSGVFEHPILWRLRSLVEGRRRPTTTSG
jgi:peptidoglycan/xylan/chitin deacetylase (PgdA/CDA1 family)